MKIKKLSIFCFISFFIFLSPAVAFDHSTWDQFLRQYVNEKGEVNYQAVAKNPDLLDEYLKQIASVNPAEINTWIREEGLAFWLNVYNACVVKLIADHYPIQSIQEIPSAWDLTVAHIGPDPNPKAKPGQSVNPNQYSLNDIRTKNLMSVYRDEKIHLVLACGARDCPPLKREAFTAPRVEGQIFLAARQLVNNPKYVQIVPGSKKIQLSRIFKWYAPDFDLDFGSPERIGKFQRGDVSILSFLAYYLEDDAKIEYLQEGNYKIKYFPFDWSLNEWKEKV